MNEKEEGSGQEEMNGKKRERIGGRGEKGKGGACSSQASHGKQNKPRPTPLTGKWKIHIFTANQPLPNSMQDQ